MIGRQWPHSFSVLISSSFLGVAAPFIGLQFFTLPFFPERMRTFSPILLKFVALVV